MENKIVQALDHKSASLGISYTQLQGYEVRGGEIRGYSEEVGGSKDGDSGHNESGSTSTGVDLALFIVFVYLHSAGIVSSIDAFDGNSDLVTVSFTRSLVSFGSGFLDAGHSARVADFEGVLLLINASTFVFNDGGGGSSKDKGTSEGFHDV